MATVIAELPSARRISLSDGGCTASAMPLVLVIDDDDSFRDLVTLGLVANGFAVRRASDGVDGLRQLATCRPLAILTDMQMPHMDGLAFCLRVRSMRAFDDTAIVVLSAGGSSSERMGAAAQLRGV
ncbi:MAG: response regulator, partial [Candidatus Dormibacteraeota bacterium]|nr:response regulator [Candidatus Dormibacteraeota bacterium]